VLRIRDPGLGAFFSPGSGIRNRFIPDPGSWITSRIRNTACKMFGPFKSSILVYIIAYHQPWVKVMLILVAVAAVAVLQTKTYLESVVGNPPAWPLILKENKLFSWSVEILLVRFFFKFSSNALHPFSHGSGLLLCSGSASKRIFGFW
jgi:hypothetical protein